MLGLTLGLDGAKVSMLSKVLRLVSANEKVNHIDKGNTKITFIVSSENSKNLVNFIYPLNNKL